MNEAKRGRLTQRSEGIEGKASEGRWTGGSRFEMGVEKEGENEEGKERKEFRQLQLFSTRFTPASPPQGSRGARKEEGERTVISHIVNDDDTVSASVVGRGDGSETLLSCRSRFERAANEQGSALRSPHRILRALRVPASSRRTTLSTSLPSTSLLSQTAERAQRVKTD